jgi:hypothetical protein
MNLSELEKDLQTVLAAIEQSAANHNVLIGQKQGLEHVITKMKQVAVAVENAANVVEGVIEPAPAASVN